MTTWVYNAIGRLTEVDEPYGSVVSYSYDVRSRKSAMGLSGVGLTTYTYDSRGRLRLIDNPYAETTTYSYDALSRPSRQDNDNGAYTMWAYNNAGWMTGVTNKKSDASVISSFAYNYDNVGKRTWVTEANGDKVTWSYDDTYQLTRERRDGDNSYDVTFTYDAVGNRATKLSGGTTTTYTYDAANKMTVTNDGTTLSTFTYDSNGNQTVKNVGGSLTTYTYSVENKMTGITYADSSLNTFTYDGDGKRLQKQDSVGTLRLVYDHQGPTGLYDLAKETDGSNNLVAFYTQGPMLISQRRGGNGYWYHDDALGSTSAITSANETTTSTYKYYAFGEVLTSTGTLTNPFKYVGGLGYYSDPDSGLLLLRARYYWPGIARFLTRDMISDTGGLYIYVRSSPLGSVDPLGMMEWPVDVERMAKLLREAVGEQKALLCKAIGLMGSAFPSFIYVLANVEAGWLAGEALRWRGTDITDKLHPCLAAELQRQWNIDVSKVRIYLGGALITATNKLFGGPPTEGMTIDHMIAFKDNILKDTEECTRQHNMELVAHEFWHVVQNEGDPHFLTNYVLQWLKAGCKYEGIAYEYGGMWQGSYRYGAWWVGIWFAEPVPRGHFPMSCQ